MAERKLKLNQIIAIEKTTKNRIQGEVTSLYNQLKKPDLYSGLSREYTPKEDDGEKLPSESKKVQFTVAEHLNDVRDLQQELWDVILTKDIGNCESKADIVVEDQTLATNVPVTTLLYLEKRLDELRTIIDVIPVLDASQNWQRGEDGLSRSEPKFTSRTKNVEIPQIVVQATEEHPAQYHVHKDTVIVGTWENTQLSGALSATQKRDMQRKINKLREAVKQAREKANMQDVERQHNFGKSLLDYVLG